MKKEYDFSKGVRGRFYKPDVKIDLPVYLSADNKRFIEKIAKKKHTDLSAVVNQLISSDRQLAKSLG